MVDIKKMLVDQQAYYSYRAEDWNQWIRNYMRPVQDEVDQLIRDSPLYGDILEMACGTGFWTARLSEIAHSVTAVDGSVEMLHKIRSREFSNVDTIHADLFSWNPPTQWDAVFFAHWIAHVPDSHFDDFWSIVDAALLPDGHVAIVDVTPAEKRIEEDLRDDRTWPVTRRRLKDGRKFNVIKKFWEPDDLMKRINSLGWSGTATPVGADRGYGFVYYLLHRTNDE